MIQKFTKKRNQKGFTLVELLIVIAIIGILAAIAIPQFSSYRLRAYNSAAKSDAKNAYTSAQAYFSDHPGSTPGLTDLTAYGYNQSSGVTLGGTLGPEASLAMTSVHSATNAQSYAVSSAGVITP
ncbi:MAG: pilus assembly protein [Deltaproteobacteria bacterium RBG_13_43_22]|nr:MAG: pilus assembly protein [Deltaproteobacteria bacterium RBG_13_43_22]